MEGVVLIDEGGAGEAAGEEEEKDKGQRIKDKGRSS